MSRVPHILFPVVLEPDALLRFKDPEHKQTHVAAEKFVRLHGILSFGPGDKEALHEAINDLRGRPHRLWSGVVEYLKLCQRSDDHALSTPLAEFLDSAATLQDSAERVRLALVARGASTPSKKAIRLNTSERVTLPNIDESRAISEAGGIGTFPVGTSRKQIAEQLLEPLARRSRLVRVMDPQMLEDFIKNGKKNNPAHLEWLLGVLGKVMPAGATISLIGTLQNTWSTSNRAKNEAQLREFVDAALRSRSEPLTVKIRLVQAVPQPIKDRFLWFDCAEPFDVLHNFAALSADPLKEPFRVIRQEEINFKETGRLAQVYENTIQPGMVSVTKVVP